MSPLYLTPRRDDTPSLRHVILSGVVTESQLAGLQSEASAVGVQLHSFAQVSALGEANPKPLKTPEPDDVAIVCYTSGTTGMEKGTCIG